MFEIAMFSFVLLFMLYGGNNYDESLLKFKTYSLTVKTFTAYTFNTMILFEYFGVWKPVINVV